MKTILFAMLILSTVTVQAQNHRIYSRGGLKRIASGDQDVYGVYIWTPNTENTVQLLQGTHGDVTIIGNALTANLELVPGGGIQMGAIGTNRRLLPDAHIVLRAQGGFYIYCSHSCFAKFWTVSK